MARCFYCCHCGRCGPSSYDPHRNPPGFCPFCQTQNEPQATVCEGCGKPLPRQAGVIGKVAENENVQIAGKDKGNDRTA